MPTVTTKLQAMSHPTVVATINTLAEMADCLREENERLKKPWVGLTDEDIHNTVGYDETREMYQFALALIAKLKEKNA